METEGGNESSNSVAQLVFEVDMASSSNMEANDVDKDATKTSTAGRDTSEKTVPFHKLFAFADTNDVILMILGTVGSMGYGAMMPLMTLLFGKLINSFGGATTDKHNVVHEVTKVALEFVYLAVGAGVASFLQVACWIVTGERQAARIRNMYLRTILRQDVAFFDTEASTGEIVGRMSGDTILIQDAMGEKVGKFIQLMTTFLGSFVVSLVEGWLLTLVLLTTIPLIMIAGGIMSVLITNATSRGTAAYAEAAVVVEQTVSAIRTVASFTGEKKCVDKYKESLKGAHKSSVHEGWVSGFGFGAIMMIFNLGYALGVWYGGKLILDKGYTGGSIINVILAILMGSMTLGQASPCINAFSAGRAAAFKMFETINRKPEIDAYDAKGKKLADIRGDIELKNVYFSYPSRPDEQIFSGFSLFIRSGASVALVGGSGSGKSTVISLIQRFYDPQAGEVLIDGINLKDFQLRWIRGKIGLVSQEPVLFASSIRDNIAYGKDGATNEEIGAAAALANATKFIDKMPEGMDTMVGEHGTQMSGGQKQRIAIARAILKDPRILLLDEATSALDSESERVVQEALDRVMENRTTVTVAHRLTTIRNADMIAVIHQGSIVEKGSHADLLKNPEGAYCQLIQLQDGNKDGVRENPGKELKQSSGKYSFHRSMSKHELRQPSGKNSFNGSMSQRTLETGSYSFSMSKHFPLAFETEEGTTEQADEETTPEKPVKVPLRRLAYLNKPEIPQLLFGAIASIVLGVLQPVFGILFGKIIKAFFQPPEKIKSDTSFWALVFVINGLVQLVFHVVKSYFFAVAGSQLIRRIRLMTFEKVVRMEIGWFDGHENSSGAIGARLSADAALVRGLVGDALGLSVQNIATVSAALVIAFTASWELSLVVLALIPLVGLGGWLQMRFMTGFSADAKAGYEEASQVANDAVGSIRTVASFSAEAKVMELYTNKCENPLKAGIRQGYISGFAFGFSSFTMFCIYSVSFYAGAKLVQAGRTSFSNVFQVFFALVMAAVGMSQSSSLVPDSGKAKIAAASVFAIVDRKSQIDSSNDTGLTPERLNGNIEFQHVSFKYPTRPDVQIFQDFCLAIQSGKTVALVGESGSGKSTAISLLQRFYDPDSGCILLDGIEIKSFQLKWLRQQMGLVSQEPTLFNDTIRANIAYGKEGMATEDEIIAAAKSANAHNFISGLQQGYETLVGERGTQLSGGQKQRVAIARAIVKDPKILLLDEATSALDAESEKIVQDALDRVMANRTTVVVAHRLSTIRNADLIGVVKNGVIIEKGRHETLVKIKDGNYASLVALHSSGST